MRPSRNDDVTAKGQSREWIGNFRTALMALKPDSGDVGTDMNPSDTKLERCSVGPGQDGSLGECLRQSLSTVLSGSSPIHEVPVC